MGVFMRPEDEVEALLPWYVAGSVSDEEKALVKAALARKPALQNQIDMIREDMAAVRTAVEAVPAPDPEPGFAALMQRLAVEPQPAAESTGGRSAASSGAGARRDLAGFDIPRALTAPFTVLFDWIARPAVFAPLALACLLLVVGQAAVIAALLGQPGKYGMASVPGKTVMGDVALIAFAPGATAADVEALLAAEGLRIVDGPIAGGVYHVQLAANMLSPGERDAKLERLRGVSSLVRLVQPTGH